MNIGDSRAFYSKNRGTELQIASYDHKPHFFSEMQRIFKHKGQLYRVCSNRMTGQTEIYYASNHQEFLQIDRIPEEGNERIFGPWRVKPGGLSVSFLLKFSQKSHFSLFFVYFSIPILTHFPPKNPL
jgi:hypothetical protein